MDPFRFLTNFIMILVGLLTARWWVRRKASHILEAGDPTLIPLWAKKRILKEDIKTEDMFEEYKKMTEQIILFKRPVLSALLWALIMSLARWAADSFSP